MIGDWVDEELGGSIRALYRLSIGLASQVGMTTSGSCSGMRSRIKELFIRVTVAMDVL